MEPVVPDGGRCQSAMTQLLLAEPVGWHWVKETESCWGLFVCANCKKPNPVSGGALCQVAWGDETEAGALHRGAFCFLACTCHT